MNRLIGSAIFLMLIINPGFLTAGTPTINITYPTDGARLTNRTVNITGTALGSEHQWFQTSKEDFDNGTYDNTTSTQLGDLKLDGGIYDDFNDNILDKDKWIGPNETGGISASENGGVFKISGTSNTIGSYCKIVSTEIFTNYVSANMIYLCGTGNEYSTALGVGDESQSIELVVKYYEQFKIFSGSWEYYENGDVLGGGNVVIDIIPTNLFFSIYWNSTSILFSINNNSDEWHPIKPIHNPNIFIVTKMKSLGDSISVGWDNISHVKIFSGNYFSQILNTNTRAPELNNILWNSSIPHNTFLSIMIRSHDNPIINDSIAWIPITNNQSSGFLEMKRFLQYLINFTSTDGLISPVFNDISIRYSIPVTKVETSIDKQVSWQPAIGSNNWSAILNLPENRSIIFIKVTDDIGEITISSIDVDVDTTPPTGTFIIDNGAQFTNNRNITLLLNASDAYGVASIMISENPQFLGATWSSFAPLINFTLSIGDGDKIIYLKMKDSNGWESTIISNRIVLDTIPPVLTILINGGAKYTNRSIVSIELNATDNYCITSMILSEDALFTGGSVEPFQPRDDWNLSPTEGLKTVYCKVVDIASNGKINTSSIVFDGTPPHSSILFLPSIVQERNFTVQWAGVDITSGIQDYNVQFRDGNEPWKDWQIGTNDTTGIFFGHNGHSYSFRVQARDNADNQEIFPENGSSPVLVNIPTPSPLLPEVSILKPSNNSIVAGAIILKGSAHHNQVGKNIIDILIKIDNRSWQKVEGTIVWYYRWNTFNESNGHHIVYFRAYDGEDYSGIVRLDIIVKNESVKVETFPHYGLILIIIPILLLIVIIFIKKRRKE
jgi:hypothetical protein